MEKLNTRKLKLEELETSINPEEWNHFIDFDSINEGHRPAIRFTSREIKFIKK